MEGALVHLFPAEGINVIFGSGTSAASFAKFIFNMDFTRSQETQADVNIEFAVTSKFATDAQRLAWALEVANEKYATDYPASVSSHMTNTDSGPFQDLVAAISLRENERGTQIGNGWDPQWHQPTDVYSTYNDKDFRLGLNAAQTTLAGVALLTGAKLKR